MTIKSEILKSYTHTMMQSGGKISTPRRSSRLGRGGVFAAPASGAGAGPDRGAAGAREDPDKIRNSAPQRFPFRGRASPRAAGAQKLRPRPWAFGAVSNFLPELVFATFPTGAPGYRPARRRPRARVFNTRAGQGKTVRADRRAIFANSKNKCALKKC